MNKSQVAAIRCDTYNPLKVTAALQKQLDLLGGLRKFVSPGQTVLLKPNFIAPKPRHLAAQTDPAIIIALAQMIKDLGANPIVADSPAWGSVTACVKVLGLEEPLKKLNVPALNLNKPVTCVIKRKKVKISSIALDADVIINLPKFKSHQQLTATFTVKNMFGCVTGKQKPLWHYKKGKSQTQFCKFLIEIYKHLNPALTIIDAVTAMQGPGPINGQPKHLGFIIASTDPIALETICAKSINLPPENIPIIQTAKDMNFGTSNMENINLLGDNILTTPCLDFQIPPQIPIKFSLPRVIKSNLKQLLRKIKKSPTSL